MGEGVASASITAYKAESGRSLTATDGGSAGTSNAFTVAPGPLDYFTIANILGQTAGTGLQRHRHRVRPVGQRQDELRGTAPHCRGTFTNSTRGCGTGNTSPCSPIYGDFDLGCTVSRARR